MKNKISLTRILEISIPALVVFAVSWGIYTTKISAQEEQISALEAKYERVMEMKTDIGVIKSQVGDLRTDMAEIKRILNTKL